MRKLLPIFSMLVLSMTGCDQSQVGKSSLPEGIFQLVVRGDEVSWVPCPTNLPPGCEIAVLEGSPQTPDLFSVRFRLKRGFVMPPHTHPKEERVTVLGGRVSVAFGLGATQEEAKSFGPGDYYVNARDAVHTVWAEEASVIQVTGFGPWEAHFVDSENSIEQRR